MRLKKISLIVSVLVLALIGLSSQLAMAQKATDELASIACNQVVENLKLTGKAIADQGLARLAEIAEAREAAANVLSDRLRSLMEFPETRRDRVTLNDLAALCPTAEGRQAVVLALTIAYATDPIIIERGRIMLEKAGDTHSVHVPAGAGYVFLFVGPGPAELDYEINAVTGTIKAPKGRVASAGAPASPSQTLKLVAKTDNVRVSWSFAEGGRFGLGTSVRGLPSSPGPKGLPPLIAEAKTFEKSLGLANAMLRAIPSLLLSGGLDEILPRLEDIVGGKAVTVAGDKVDGALQDVRVAVAEELAGFYGIHGGSPILFGDDVCKVLLDRANTAPNPELRWAAAKAFFSPVRLRRAGEEFWKLCPEDRILSDDEKREWDGGDHTKFLDIAKRISLANKGQSEELRAAAAGDVAKPLADLTLPELLKKLDGQVPPEDLVKFLKEFTGTASLPEYLLKEKALELIAIRGVTKEIKKAAGWALGLLWEEWLRTGKSSRIVDLKADPQKAEGLYRFVIANNAPGCTACWKEYAAAAIAPMARHFAGEITFNFSVPVTYLFRRILVADIGKF